MYIDSHAHLNFKEYENDIKDVLERSFDVGVKKIVNVGSNYKTSVKSVKSVKSIKGVELYSVIGCHPIHLTQDITESAKFDGKEYKFTTKKEEFDVKKYQKIIDSSDKVVAVGETGLDYYHLKTQNLKLKTISKNLKLEKEIQKRVFKEHIELAIENDLPLVLHCRGSKDKPYEAYDEMIEILKLVQKEEATPATPRKLGLHGGRGVAHCFVGNLAQAKEFIKMGFYIGVNGIVTFKNSKELQNIIKEIPLKNIVLETDCPFLAPDPYRGKRNEPAYIPIIAQKIAELKDVDVGEVEKITTDNCKKLFNI